MNRQTILGSGGAIGRELATALRKYSDSVRLVSRRPVAIHRDDELMAGDVTKREDVHKAVEGSEVVYLTVGFPYSRKVWHDNWPKTMAYVLEACEKHGARLVFFDNVYMYDPAYMGHMTEETPHNPSSEKGKIREMIASQFMDAVKKGKIEGLIARSADFYGPGIKKTSMLTEMMLDNLAKGRKANWLGGRDFVHSFTYVPDAANGTALLGNTPEAYGQVWHLPTSSERWTADDWCREAAGRLKVSPRMTVIRPFMLRLMGKLVPVLGEIREMAYQYDRGYFFSSEKFEKAFAMRPVSYGEGLDVIVEKDYRSGAFVS